MNPVTNPKTFRYYLKSATREIFWLRYISLAAWRLLYAAYATLTHRNISGQHDESPEALHQYAKVNLSCYKLWAGIEHFHGRVAEVGPGGASALAELLLADGCLQVDQVDRFTHATSRPSSPDIYRYRAAGETFFNTHGGYDYILSCAVMEHLTDPLQALRSMAGALKPGGVMIHAVDCRDHGQFSKHLHDLSFLRIPPFLYFPQGREILIAEILP